MLSFFYDAMFHLNDVECNCWLGSSHLIKPLAIKVTHQKMICS